MEKQAEHQLLFFFNDTATTEIYTLSLHDALPISHLWRYLRGQRCSSIRLRQAELELIKTHAVIENVQRGDRVPRHPLRDQVSHLTVLEELTQRGQREFNRPGGEQENPGVQQAVRMKQRLDILGHLLQEASP